MTHPMPTSALPRAPIAPPFLPLAVDPAFCPPGLGPNVQSFLALVEVAGRSLEDHDVVTAGHALRQALAQREAIEREAKKKIETAPVEACSQALVALGRCIKKQLSEEDQVWLASLLRGISDLEGSKLHEAWASVVERFAPPITKFMRKCAELEEVAAAERGEGEELPEPPRERPKPRPRMQTVRKSSRAAVVV